MMQLRTVFLVVWLCVSHQSESRPAPHMPYHNHTSPSPLPPLPANTTVVCGCVYFHDSGAGNHTEVDPPVVNATTTITTTVTATATAHNSSVTYQAKHASFPASNATTTLAPAHKCTTKHASSASGLAGQSTRPSSPNHWAEVSVSEE